MMERGGGCAVTALGSDWGTVMAAVNVLMTLAGLYNAGDMLTS
jgi:hypothetical protein